MQRLEISGAVRQLYGSLGVKGLSSFVETYLRTLSQLCPIYGRMRCAIGTWVNEAAVVI